MTASLIPAGQTAESVAPGDILLVDRPGVVPGVIKLGQRIRPSMRPWARFAHVVCVYDKCGITVEALTRGVVFSYIDDYRHVPYTHVRTGLSAKNDQRQAREFLYSCVGQRYGLLNDLGIALRFLTPGRGLWFGANGTENCSGLAAQMLCRGNAIFADNPASLCPAELGAHYQVGP